MGKEFDDIEQEYEDDLLSQIHQITDADILKQLLIQKEQERIGLASNLDLAARLGLDLHQKIQRQEQEMGAQIQSLQDENHVLQSKASLSQELQYQLANSEHEVKELTGHNRFLQRELDTCRQELKAFRKELDELSEHMAEISSEMFDAKNKVNSYARRLGEVEQELASTQELNVNLQIQLDNALQKQKQTHSTTTQAVKMIQSDLGKVFSDSDTMRMTLEELETRQLKCEGKVMEMMTNTREYAQLLEEAQETIHTLRIESDLEGRGAWSTRGPQAAIWDNQTGEDPEHHMLGFAASRPRIPRQLSATAQNSDTSYHSDRDSKTAKELDPMFDDLSLNTAQGNSLGMELGHNEAKTSLNLDHRLSAASRGLKQELADTSLTLDRGLTGLSRKMDEDLEYHGYGIPLDQELRAEQATSSLASELAAIENRTTFENDVSSDEHESVQSPPQRSSLSAELHQRLEENNILQNVLPNKPSWKHIFFTPRYWEDPQHDDSCKPKSIDFGFEYECFDVIIKNGRQYHEIRCNRWFCPFRA
ncbi:hypothetical protein BX616_009206 [Lobosporangium transversale]|nr:hypothetical protein BX616_009206 [Lobosporangium transversale]